MTRNKNPLLATMLALTGDRNVITIHHATVVWLGDLHTAMMFEQILYWSPRATDPDGWIIKSDREWCEELHLTRYSVRAAAYALTERKIVQSLQKKWGNSMVNAYRPDFEQVEKQWLEFIEKPLSENGQWSPPLSENEQWSPPPPSENGHSSITEITPSENTPRAALGFLTPGISGPDPRWNFEIKGDYSNYPQDVQPFLIEFCLAFNFAPPQLAAKRSPSRGQAALWISELRDLADACGKHGPIAIQWYRGQFYLRMLKNRKRKGEAVPPHDVNKPGSITNMVRGMVAAIDAGEYQPFTEEEVKAGKIDPQVQAAKREPKDRAAALKQAQSLLEDE